MLRWLWCTSQHLYRGYQQCMYVYFAGAQCLTQIEYIWLSWRSALNFLYYQYFSTGHKIAIHTHTHTHDYFLSISAFASICLLLSQSLVRLWMFDFNCYAAHICKTINGFCRTIIVSWMRYQSVLSSRIKHHIYAHSLTHTHGTTIFTTHTQFRAQWIRLW